VVLAHGFANWHRHARVHSFATALAADASVIVVDLRGHGLSEGVTSVGANEWLDVAAAVAVAPESDAVVLVGTSMGAGASIVYAGVAAAGGLRRVDAVVAVSGPAWWTYRGNQSGVRGVLSAVTSPLTRRVMRTLLRVRSAKPPAQGWIDPVSVVGAIAPTPVVLVHDAKDWYFGIDHIAALEAAGEVEVWWCEGGHATDLLTDDLRSRVAAEVVGPVGRNRVTDA
jgi:pimeloyl-ACP methyl ester carboxylesterase